MGESKEPNPVVKYLNTQLDGLLDGSVFDTRKEEPKAVAVVKEVKPVDVKGKTTKEVVAQVNSDLKKLYSKKPTRTTKPNLKKWMMAEYKKLYPDLETLSNDHITSLIESLVD